MAKQGWPTADDRSFVAAVNALSVKHASAGFGDPGMLTAIKARRQLAFARAARTLWPSLGELRTVEVAQWNGLKVDVKCKFWQAGHQRYMEALGRYLRALGSRRADAEAQRSLLSDLGFLCIEDFVSAEEEQQLLSYWSPTGNLFSLGTEEKRSRRRFFNYGPILPKETQGTTKSTLHVTPSVFGAMPPLIEKQRLRPRIRAACPAASEGEDAFDQMYVNYYDASIHSYIDYHHDHMSCMRGLVAGLSLGSSCTLRLRPLEYRQSNRSLCIDLPSRSLFFLTGLSRWHLQHAIMDMRQDRLSLTFRTVDRSGGRPQLWRRSWAQLRGLEAANAQWPLVTPEGCELHRLDHWSWCTDSFDTGGRRGDGGHGSNWGHSYYRRKVPEGKMGHRATHTSESGRLADVEGSGLLDKGYPAQTRSKLEDLGHFFEGQAGRRGRGGRSFYRAEPRDQRVQQLFDRAETSRTWSKWDEWKTTKNQEWWGNRRGSTHVPGGWWQWSQANNRDREWR